jgi:hypothetical protein
MSLVLTVQQAKNLATHRVAPAAVAMATKYQISGGKGSDPAPEGLVRLLPGWEKEPAAALTKANPNYKALKGSGQTVSQGGSQMTVASKATGYVAPKGKKGAPKAQYLLSRGGQGGGSNSQVDGYWTPYQSGHVKNSWAGYNVPFTLDGKLDKSRNVWGPQRNMSVTQYLNQVRQLREFAPGKAGNQQYIAKYGNLAKWNPLETHPYDPSVLGTYGPTENKPRRKYCWGQRGREKQERYISKAQYLASCGFTDQKDANGKYIPLNNRSTFTKMYKQAMGVSGKGNDIRKVIHTNASMLGRTARGHPEMFNGL